MPIGEFLVYAYDEDCHSTDQRLRADGLAGVLVRGHGVRHLAQPHPRRRLQLPAHPRTRIHKLLAFVGDRGDVHPRDVDAHFSHGTVTNYWGGSSRATTHLLEELAVEVAALDVVVEDAVDALKWAASIGGLAEMIVDDQGAQRGLQLLAHAAARFSPISGRRDSRRERARVCGSRREVWHLTRSLTLPGPQPALPIGVTLTRWQHTSARATHALLDLAYQDGRYLIAGERTEGFVPAG